MIIKVNPVIQNHIQNLCVLPYMNHKSGCPNFSKKAGCPPCQLYDEVYDVEQPIYAIK